MYDKSTKILIAVNLINIVLAIVFRWSVYDVMLVYWFQSVSIGIFTFYKLYTYPLEEIDREISEGNTLEVNDLAVTKPRLAKMMIAGFFAIHYGFFHLVYIIFIVGFASSEGFPLDLIGGLVGALLFFANHLYSYLFYRNEDRTAETGDFDGDQSTTGFSIADIFSKPYTRIIPIHLTIIAGGFISQLVTGGPFQNIIILLLFMSLKTVMDVVAHKKKHKQILFAVQDT